MIVSSVPVIDIEPLARPDSKNKRRTVEAIGRASREIGFFYVANHGVPENLIARTYAQARRFHALPEQAKRRYHIAGSRNHRGYVPPGEEDYGSEPGEGSKESFDLAADLPADDPDYLRGYRYLGPNVWPDLPGFKDDVSAYYDAVMGLGRTLLHGFASALGLDETYFDRYFTKPTSNLRLLRYPEKPDRANRASLGIGSHTDSEAFTILHQTRPGLQVMDTEDRWVDVAPIEGTFVINTGDMMEVWTNGLFRSSPHRVMNIAEERFSLPLFFAPDFDTRIEPLAQFVTPECPRAYDGFVSGEHILSEYAKGFRYLRDLHRRGAISLSTDPAEESRFVRAERSA